MSSNPISTTPSNDANTIPSREESPLPIPPPNCMFSFTINPRIRYAGPIPYIYDDELMGYSEESQDALSNDHLSDLSESQPTSSNHTDSTIMNLMHDLTDMAARLEIPTTVATTLAEDFS